MRHPSPAALDHPPTSTHHVADGDSRRDPTTRRSPHLQSHLVAAVRAMQPVTLAELDQAQLHDRVESKVILVDADLPAALGRLAELYRVMEHQGQRFQHYRNDYFDTADRRNYREHHNRNGRRIKVRYRTYANSDLTFFEVKRSLGGRTIKDRRKSEAPGGRLSPADAAFFYRKTGWPPSVLEPSVTIRYDRVLLVKSDLSERVTVDINLTFASDGVIAQMPGLAICEFKQPRLDRRSPAMEALDRRPQMFSKYCMGLAACHPTLRRNRFKKVFRNLDSLGASATSRKQITL